MSENRKDCRKKSTFYLKVYDRKEEQMVGNLRDISVSGIKLNSAIPLKTGKIYSFGLSLPDALTGVIPISITAKSIWCRKNEATKLYDTGFRFIDLPNEYHDAIINSTDSYLFRDC